MFVDLTNIENLRRNPDKTQNLLFESDETIIIPADPPYTARFSEVPDDGKIQSRPIITDFTELYSGRNSYISPSSTNTYWINYSTGDIIFHSSNAGQIVHAAYWKKGSYLDATKINVLIDSLKTAALEDHTHDRTDLDFIVDQTDVTNTPSVYPASDHTHDFTDIVGDVTGNINITGNYLINNEGIPLHIFRNKIINGDMRLDSRNEGAEINPAVSETYYVDRQTTYFNLTNKLKIGQNAGAVTPPSGFTNYLGFTSLSSYAIQSGDTFICNQKIEGLNVSDLAWGTIHAKTTILSFYVYSSLTGTFGGSIRNHDGGRSYPFQYTINQSNTFERKIIVIPGDTTGSWVVTKEIGIQIGFGLGVGSTYSGTAGSWAGTNYLSSTGATSVVGTNGATFYITGVQFECGTVATPFEHRPYAIEHILCQRYLPIFMMIGTMGNGIGYDVNKVIITMPFKTAARRNPTGILVVNTNYFNVCDGVSVFTASSIAYYPSNVDYGGIDVTTTTNGAVAYRPYYGYAGGPVKILFTGCEL